MTFKVGQKVQIAKQEYHGRQIGTIIRIHEDSIRIRFNNKSTYWYCTRQLTPIYTVKTWFR